MGSIPCRDGLKFLEMVLVAFPLGAKDYGNSTTAVLQCQDNGLVKYKETRIRERSPLTN